MKDDELTPEMKKKIEEAQEEIVQVFAHVDDVQFLRDFLTCLCSPSELFDFGKRWLLVKEINAGKTQREIAKDFKMSLCKITRGSKELKKEGSAFRRLLDGMDLYNSEGNSIVKY
ncbi:MAG: trp operon repressor [Treponemataceae bacterium]|nr:trp operon repressor [Treponemataceae bacterium]